MPIVIEHVPGYAVGVGLPERRIQERFRYRRDNDIAVIEQEGTGPGHAFGMLVPIEAALRFEKRQQEFIRLKTIRRRHQRCLRNRERALELGRIERVDVEIGAALDLALEAIAG